MGLVVIAIIILILIAGVLFDGAAKKRKQRRYEEECRAELGRALEIGYAKARNEAEAMIAPVRERLKTETDGAGKKLYAAFVENYPRIKFTNLFTERKKGLESRPDFSSDFVQEFYAENNRRLEEVSALKTFDIYPDIPQDSQLLFGALSSAYEILALSDSGLQPSTFFNLKAGTLAIPAFRDVNGYYVLIYPTFIIIYKGDNNFEIIDIERWSQAGFHFITSVSDYTEYDTGKRVPYNAKIVGYEWLHMTKKGEPDARYSVNPRFTRYKRCTLIFSPLNVTVYTADLEAAERIKSAFRDLAGGDIASAMERQAQESTERDMRENSVSAEDDILRDPVFYDMARYIVSSQTASISNLQRKFSIGYSKAGRYMDALEEYGIVGAARGIRPREILVNEEALESVLKSLKPEPEKPVSRKHKVGDRHPSKPWVWTEYAPGKFDWRKDKSING